jgi:glycosyltransferase involved in cell wall biosynthesis
MQMIFHYPGPFHAVMDNGERKRPRMMCEAFRALGHEVIPVVGTWAERAAQVARLAQDSGLRPACCYSENSHLPLRLVGERHLPRWPSPDVALCHLLHRRGIPHGVYYRDMYWRYADFRRQVGWGKYALAWPFYHEELRLYRACGMQVFVPSAEFAAETPVIPPERLHPLPPGETAHPLPPVTAAPPLKLIYVGGATPPRYDLTPLFDHLAAVTHLPLHLDLVTPAGPWAACRDAYRLPPNVTVRHAAGAELAPLLTAADLALLWYDPHPYRRLALPVKLYEALGFGLPVISFGDNPVSRFVTAHRAGWVAEATAGEAFWTTLLADLPALAAAKERVRVLRQEHTWEARARTAAAILLGQAG